MQSGVAAKMDIDPADEVTPKHLRVGINSSLVNSSSLASLLISKGIITELEYITAVADGMEDEKKAYEEYLREATGNDRISLL
jgi:hypothetical protein